MSITLILNNIKISHLLFSIIYFKNIDLFNKENIVETIIILLEPLIFLILDYKIILKDETKSFTEQKIKSQKI